MHSLAEAEPEKAIDVRHELPTDKKRRGQGKGTNWHARYLNKFRFVQVVKQS
jgi:hypothetical protein